VISSEPVPKDLKFLPMIEKLDGEFKSDGNFLITIKAHIRDIRHEIMPGKVNIILSPEEGAAISEENIYFNQNIEDYDLIITVDTGGLEQLGDFYEKHLDLFKQLPVINIDHHASNTLFGVLNLVDSQASATTEILTPLIAKIETRVDKKFIDSDLATLLLAGIITDTGSFQHSNTTPKAFSIAAQLLAQGARQQEIIKNIYKTKSLSTLRLWGQVLSKIQFEKDYHLVWSTISQADLQETGAEMEESGAIIDELLNNAPGAEIVALFKEKQEGLLSCSLRTTTDQADASLIAEIFGGGGHKRAAGFRLKGIDFEEGVRKIVNAIREVQGKSHGIPMEITNQRNSEKKEPSIKIQHNTGQENGHSNNSYYRFEH